MANPCIGTGTLYNHDVFETCRMYRGLPCAPCREYMDLEARTMTSNQTPDKLNVQQRVVRTKINELHDPITRNLPQEVVSIIFRFSLPDDWTLGEGNDLEEGYADWRYEDLRGRGLVAGALFLGAVCRSWRQTAWQTPSLWTSIRIFLQKPQTLSDLDIISECLGRSGQLPLSICLSDNNDDPDEEDDLDFELGPDEVTFLLISLIDGYSSRWEYLDIDGPYQTMKLLGENSQCASSLRYLNVENLRHDGTLFRGMAGTKPRPENVWMRHCLLKALDIDWNHVLNVSLEDVHLSECFKLLLCAPQLARCRLSIGQKTESFPIPNRPIVHRGLQSLAFLFWHQRPAENVARPAVFFDSFDFPNLTDYRFNAMCDPFPATLPLHIARSSCPLTSLTITNTDYDYESLLELLQETPRLLNLNLSSFFMPETYLLDLIRLLADTSVSSPSDKLVPNLQAFEFIWTRDTPNTDDQFWDLLADIIGPIDQIENPDRRPLTKLRVNWPVDVVPETFEPTMVASSADIPSDSESGEFLAAIRRGAVVRLLELEDAGVVLDLGDRFGQFDLLELSMKYHGIVRRSGS